MAKNSIRKPVAGRRARHVPVIMQMEATECGAASLSMVLAYYGKWVTLQQARQDCGVSRDGSKMGNIMRAAIRYGMEAKAYSMSVEQLRTGGTFPCILYWGFNHFVVCDGFQGDHVWLNDPAKGEVRLSMKAFEEGFTGIVMMLQPGADFQPSGKRRSMVGYALDKLKSNRTTLFFVALTTAIISLLGILTAGFSRVFLDRMLTGLEKDWTRPFLLLFACVTLTHLMTAWIQAIYSLRLKGKMAIEGNCSYMWKLLRLPMAFFSQHYAGDLLSRKKENALIAKNITEILAPIAINTMMMVFYFVAMVRYSWLLTVICVGVVAAQTASAQLISRHRINISRVMLRDQSKLDSTTVSAVSMIESIKASGAEDGYFERWAGYQAAASRQNTRYQELNYYMELIPGFLSALLNVSILVIGIHLTIRGDFTSGMILAFQGLLASFTQPANTLIRSAQQLQEMRTQMERVDDVMSAPEDPMLPTREAEAAAGAVTEGKLRGRIELRDVSFGYSPLEPPLIEHFNMVVEPGKSVAFVGASGCGKSTMTRLITGLYQPWGGEILLDGKPLKEIDHRVLTASAAVVEQEITLFEDSIENNIRMWDPTLENFEVVLAARDARIHDQIMKKEDGYRHRIREGGGNFSGGERQRIEIARALVKDPTILIMDEATSALDARSEYEITRAIRDRGITCVIVAHRLSTIRDCDEIIVLDHGKIAERGTHAELMEAGGLYRDLVTSA